MKKYIHFLLIFILLFFFSTFLKAQTIYLQWEGLKEAYSIETKSSKFPYFSNYHYSLDEGIPTLYYSESTNYTNPITLTNLQWSPISLSELGEMPISSLPESDEFAANITSARSKQMLSVTIRTFKKIGNIIS